VRVQIGPLPAVGIDLWIAYARTVIGQVLGHPKHMAVDLDPGAVEAFDRYLLVWEELADSNPQFLWVAEVEPEQVEFLGKAFLAIATALAGAAEDRGFPMAPTEGEEFYRALVNGFLEALAHAGQAQVEFSEQVRDQWPGLRPT
jgi:hypothetical protein